MPFAGYKDFDDCIRKNRDKKNPDAYCATIMRKVEEGRKNSENETTHHLPGKEKQEGMVDPHTYYNSLLVRRSE